MPWRPSASAQVRASAIWPTAAAACESSSLSAPLGSLSTERPSAIAPDDTTRISRPPACRPEISPASETSQSSCTRPAAASTSSDEPTFTTMRRKSARRGVLGMAVICRSARRLGTRPMPTMLKTLSIPPPYKHFNSCQGNAPVAIPPPYQLRLNANYIDGSVEALKPDILQILEPHLEGIVDAHMDRTIKFIPA